LGWSDVRVGLYGMA
jgi:hypothetical protein